jgi:hypothetical protein
MAQTRLSGHDRLHVHRLFSLTCVRARFRYATVYTHIYEVCMYTYRTYTGSRRFVTVRNDNGSENGTPKLYTKNYKHFQKRAAIAQSA